MGSQSQVPTEWLSLSYKSLGSYLLGSKTRKKVSGLNSALSWCSLLTWSLKVCVHSNSWQDSTSACPGAPAFLFRTQEHVVFCSALAGTLSHRENKLQSSKWQPIKFPKTSGKFSPSVLQVPWVSRASLADSAPAHCGENITCVVMMYTLPEGLRETDNLEVFIVVSVVESRRLRHKKHKVITLSCRLLS